MKIITKLKLAAWAPVIVAIITGAALFFSHATLQRDQEKNKAARRIINGAQELTNFTRTYMLHHEERPKRQFMMEYYNLTELINKTHFDNNEQRRYLLNIALNLEAMRNTFLKLVSNYEQSGLMENIPLRREAEERLAGQILIRSRDSVAHALRLKNHVDDEVVTTQERISLLIVLLIVLTTLTLAFLLLRMTRSIAVSFATLREGTQYIASGNLNHRIGLTGRDEIGELAGAFDLMAEHLGEITVSRNELLREMEERKRAQDELMKSQARYRDLFENITEEVHFWELVRDERGTIKTWKLVDANPPTLKTWGKKLEEIRGKTTDEIFGPGATEHYIRVVQKIMTEGVPHRFEDYFPLLDKYFQFTSIPLGDYFITTGFDISEIKKAIKLAERQRAEMDAAFASMSDAICIINKAGEVVDFNEAFARFHRFTSEEECLRRFKDYAATFKLYTPEGEEAQTDLWPFPRALGGHVQTNAEFIVERADLGEKWFAEYSFSPTFDPRGQISGAVIAMRDITERKRAEEALRQISQFPKENPHPVLRVALDGATLYANEAALSWLETFGWREGRPLPEVVQKTAAEAHGRDRHTETEITNPAGRTHVVFAIQPPGEDYVNLYGVDFTERKRAQEEVNRKNKLVSAANRILELSLERQTEAELGTACLAVVEEITGSAIGFINEIVDEGNLKNIAISTPGRTERRMSDEQGRSGPMGDFKIRGIYGRVLRDGKGFFSNDPVSHPDRIGLPPGHPPLESFLGVPLFREGRVMGMIAVGNRPGGYGREDLETLETLAPVIVETLERRRAEDALRRLKDELEKRVALRTAELTDAYRELEAFSYSVSHDLRAPLRSIDGFCRILLDKYLDRLDERGQNYLARVSRAAQRMGHLIDDLLRLSRIGRAPLSWKQVNVTALAQSVVGDLRAGDPERAVHVEIAPGMGARGDESLMRIALENLIGNAWKFTGKDRGGRIEIGRTQVNDRAVFYVRDNGAGFEMTYVDKLFEPFQRLHTSEEFPGSGIGLTIVKRIVTRHGGEVWAEGAVGKGATIYFTMGDDQ